MIPGFDYKTAYRESRELYDSEMVQKAIIFAANNPSMVYEEGMEEHNRVTHDGFFDLIVFLSDSASASARER